MQVLVAMETVCCVIPKSRIIKLFSWRDHLIILFILSFISKIMPLFSSKFTQKTIPVRKQDTTVIKNEFGSEYAAKELSLDIETVKLKLGDIECCFQDGQWVPASGKAGAAHKENARLKKELEQLEEENNLLRLKFEILLDMMTDKTVESEQEIQKSTGSGSLKHRSKKQKW